MEKRKDIQIYVLCHKPVEYGIPDNSLYTPLQMGSAESFTRLRDNTLYNIADQNGIYAETTGIYWIGNNHPNTLKYVGQHQYRRRLEFAEDTDFDEIFKDYDVIVAKPIALNCSIYEHYKACHCWEDLEYVRNILESQGENVELFDNIIFKGNVLFYSNGFIMKAEDYDKYCEWLFEVFRKYKMFKHWNTVEDVCRDLDAQILSGARSNARGNIYQRQIFGFLSERLWTYYLQSRFPLERIKMIPYKLMENTGI